MTKRRFIPVSPGETPLFDLEASTEEAAWEKLMKAAAHMPYRTKEHFEKRGYTVCELLQPNDQAQGRPE